MRPKLLLPSLAAGLLCLTACDVGDFGDFERYSRDFHYSYPLSPGGSLAVETFNGAIEVSTWDEKTVDISGTKFGPTQQEADTLNVSIDHMPDAISIRVVRPTYRRNNQGARFVIKVPREVRLERLMSSNGAIRTAGGTGPARIRTSNGQLQIHDLRGTLDAQTSNGGLEVFNIEGDVSAHTSNGRVRVEHVLGGLEVSSSNGGVTADVERADRPVRIGTSNSSVELTLPAQFASEVRIDTNNGGITVHMPSTMNARVMARTSNSRITSDFEMRTQGEINRNHLDGIIGSGGPLIDLTTSNGHIRLARM
jgi:hypothetical protein